MDLSVREMQNPSLSKMRVLESQTRGANHGKKNLDGANVCWLGFRIEKMMHSLWFSKFGDLYIVSVELGSGVRLGTHGFWQKRVGSSLKAQC